jgi:hypothetical protein
MLKMIYMTRIQNMLFFLLKVNNPSVCHPAWPPSGTPFGPPSGPHREPRSAPRPAPCLAPHRAPVGHPVRPRPAFFGCCCRLEKRGKNISVFSFQSPRSPSSPSSPSSAGEAARRRRFFRPSSPSHPSKLYSSLGWLNSKVPKPFFPFSLRLIDVDGF